MAQCMAWRSTSTEDLYVDSPATVRLMVMKAQTGSHFLISTSSLSSSASFDALLTKDVYSGARCLEEGTMRRSLHL